MNNFDLIKPHSKQKEIIKACTDPNLFFVVAIIGRQFGKTLIAENLAIYWALSKRDTIVYWISPTDSQIQKVYGEIIEAIHHTKVITSKKATKGDTEIVFDSGSKIIFKSAASEDNLRGGSVNYMIIDEAAFIKRETIETILMPMLAVKGKKCLFISTPKGKNYLYDYFLKGQVEPQWKSLRFSTYDSPFANKHIVDLARKSLPPKLFSQEYEAEFVDASSVFNNINEVMCLTPLTAPVPKHKYFAGIDIGLISDATVLSIFNQDGDMVKYYRWENIDTPVLIDKIIELNKFWGFYRIMIENNNQGLPIYQALRMTLNNIDSVNTNSKTKPEFINKLIHLFNMKEFKVVKDDYLRIELEGFIFKQTDTGIIRFMADSGFHDDCVMSMAIGRYCYEFYNRKKNATYLQGNDENELGQVSLLEGIVPQDMREFLI